MHLLGIDHVLLAMPPGGEPQARAFFSELLGLPEVRKPEPLATRGGCWFGSGPVIVHLGVQDGFAPATKAHPAFLVAGLDALYDRLLNAEVEVSRDGALPTVARFYAKDPFGNRLEFIQDGYGFSQA
jgi:catechol 2,3-dioxygenase-like lactoylglutathione lyase family enzyme